MFVLSARCLEPFNVKPLRLFSTRVPYLWSMTSSQDSEWSPDWTTSRTLNKCTHKQGQSWIVDAAVRVSHLLCRCLCAQTCPEGGRSGHKLLGASGPASGSPTWWSNGKEIGKERSNVRVGRRCVHTLQLRGGKGTNTIEHYTSFNPRGQNMMQLYNTYNTLYTSICVYCTILWHGWVHENVDFLVTSPLLWYMTRLYVTLERNGGWVLSVWPLMRRMIYVLQSSGYILV